MSVCKDCPGIIGDITERDCCFPDCVGGWEKAFEQSSIQCFKLQEKIEILKFKDHQIREFVNELTKITQTFKDCQCLREKISQSVNAFLSNHKGE